MPRSIRNIQRRTVVYEFLILLLALCAVLVVTGSHYIDTRRKSTQLAIEETAKQYAAFLKEFEYLPHHILESPYVMFVVDKSNDEYIIERRNRDTFDNLQWEQYQTKLIYQMQKQGQGWIEYPMGPSATFWEDRKIIRYLTLDSLGWIFALEARWPGGWTLFQDVITPFVVFQSVLIIAACFFLMRINIKRFSRKTRQRIADTLEFDSMSLGQKSRPEEAKTAGKPASSTRKTKGAFQSIEDFEPYRSVKPAPQANKSKKEEGIDSGIPAPNETVSFDAPKQQAKDPKPVMRDDIMPSPLLAEGQVQGREEALFSVHLGGIRSPVLKKMIKDLREE